MIFSCGETWEARRARLEDWHDFFPLLPRSVAETDGRHVCAWLQTIERKGKFWADWADYSWNWEYRLKGGGNG
jgi:hypothetical protein